MYFSVSTKITLFSMISKKSSQSHSFSISYKLGSFKDITRMFVCKMNREIRIFYTEKSFVTDFRLNGIVETFISMRRHSGANHKTAVIQLEFQPELDKASQDCQAWLSLNVSIRKICTGLVKSLQTKICDNYCCKRWREYTYINVMWCIY